MKALENLRPIELANAISKGLRRELIYLYGETQLLLVRVPPDDTGLLEGLGATMPMDANGRLARPQLPGMEFHTVAVTKLPGPGRRALGDRPSVNAGAEPAAVFRRLSGEMHFAIPIHKREGADAMSVDRITVGRARNRDVVLRHKSVSKFHAWFEITDMGSFGITDAGSKNGTFVNGRPIEPKQLIELQPGDEIRFGSVDTVLCPPETLFDALHGS